MEKIKATSIYLNDDLKNKIVELAKADRRSFSQMVEILLENVINYMEKRVKPNE